MISRNRSMSTAAAMFIECTTSANNTVTCLYSGASTDAVSREPHASQNREPSWGTEPHDRHTAGAVVTASPGTLASPPPWRYGPRIQGILRSHDNDSPSLDR